MRLLPEGRARLDALAQALLKNDSLDEGQILALPGIKDRQAAPTEGAIREAAAASSS